MVIGAGESEAEISIGGNVASMLWRAARIAGGRSAVVERNQSATYTELADRAGAVAAALHADGLAIDDRIGILLERGSDAAAAYFGVLAAGGIAVVINETLRPRQIEHILAHSGATRLLTGGDLLERQARPLQTGARILDLGGVAAGTGEPGDPVERLPTDVAQIIYTSGSTGQPKGVTVTHGNLLAATSTVVGYLGITAFDRIASFLPFSFVYGSSQLLCAVATGAALVVERSPLAQQMVETLRERDVTVAAAVPSLWLRLLGVGAFRRTLPALRVMTNAGGHLARGAVAELRLAQPLARLYLMYGLTEVLRSTYLPPDEVDRRPDSIGRAIEGAQVFVIRDDGTEAAPGEIGELVHRGPTVTLGYWKDPELTARVFRPNPLRPPGAPETERVVYSGDLVRRDEDGFLYFVGRKDRIIKTLGYRVGPDEIADVLHASGQVAEAIVLGEPDEQWGERIVAYVVLAPQGARDRLAAHCARELPRYMQPARIEIRDALPALPSGKPDVMALRGSLH